MVGTRLHPRSRRIAFANPAHKVGFDEPPAAADLGGRDLAALGVGADGIGVDAEQGSSLPDIQEHAHPGGVRTVAIDLRRAWKVRSLSRKAARMAGTRSATVSSRP